MQGQVVERAALEAVAAAHTTVCPVIQKPSQYNVAQQLRKNQTNSKL
jgi:hypothetical protein